jgi:hypothetical protein
VLSDRKLRLPSHVHGWLALEFSGWELGCCRSWSVTFLNLMHFILHTFFKGVFPRSTKVSHNFVKICLYI